MHEKAVLRCDAGARIEAWIAAVDAALPGDFRTIADPAELPAHARADSQYWCDQILSPEANPYDVPGVEHAIHDGDGRSPDLLRHDYMVKGLDLSVVEGRNFLLVRVAEKSLDLLALPEREWLDAVARAAGALFREPLASRTWEPLGDGSLFCTDASVHPVLLASWADRADSGVREGELWFICYKRISQLLGFANPAQWFSDTTCGIRKPRRRGARRSR